MNTKRNLLLVSVLAFALIAGLWVAPLGAEHHEGEEELPLDMRANGAVASGGRRTSMMQFRVTKWTDTAVREELIQALRDGKKVHDLLQTQDSHGRMNPAGQMGIDVRYAYQFPKDGGRTIVLASDRPISANEARQGGRLSVQYNVTLAVIELDDYGDGAGSMWVGADVVFGNDGKMEIIGAGQNPVHLGRVRVTN